MDGEIDPGHKTSISMLPKSACREVGSWPWTIFGFAAFPATILGLGMYTALEIIKVSSKCYKPISFRSRPNISTFSLPKLINMYIQNKWPGIQDTSYEEQSEDRTGGHKVY